MSLQQPHIILKNVSVEFPVEHAFQKSIKLTLIRSVVGGIMSSGKHKTIVVKAIDDATFTFSKGDRIGVTGHNGSGKTTLLRTLAGIYTPTHGTVEVSGKIVSLLNLSLGLDSESTGYENIFIKGLMFGMSPKEIESKYDRIAAFSELGDYLAMPLRTYSSGMLLRLAFSVFSETEPDILLMDEWLSVGDTSFQEKATKRIHEMLESTGLLVLASQSEHIISQVCNRRFKLDHGKLAEIEAN